MPTTEDHPHLGTPAGLASTPRFGRCDHTTSQSGSALGTAVVVTMALVPVALDPGMAALSFPRIADELGVEGTWWIVSAYLLAMAAALPLLGDLARRHRGVGLFRTALVVFAAGGIATGFANDLTQLVVSRFVQGLGAAGIVGGAIGLISATAGPYSRRYLRRFVVVGGLALAAGPVVGGLVTEYVGWQWCFFGQAALALLVGVVARLVLSRPTETPAHGPTDLAGGVLVAAVVTTTVLVAAWAASHSGDRLGLAPALAAGLGVVLLLAAALIVVERRAQNPVLPWQVFAAPAVLAATTTGLLVGVVLYGVLTALPRFLSFAAPPGGTGGGQRAVALLPLTAGALAAAVVAYTLVVLAGTGRLQVVVGLMTTGAGCVLLTNLALDDRVQNDLSVAVVGAGLGLTLVGLAVLLVAGWPAQLEAQAVVATLDGHLLGGAVGSVVAGALVDYEAVETIPDVFLYGVPVLVAALFAAVLIDLSPLPAPVVAPAPVEPPPPSPESLEPGPWQSDAPPSERDEQTEFWEGLLEDVRDEGSGLAELDRRGSVEVFVRHPDGVPVRHAVVTLTDEAGKQVARRSSGDDGACALEFAAAGSYVLIASKPGCHPIVTTLDLDRGSHAVMVELVGECSLAGHIYRNDGLPLARATVTLATADGFVAGATRSDESGSYRFDGLVPGDCTLAVTAEGYRPAAVAVQLNRPGIRRKDVELVGTGKVAGTVCSADGQFRLPGIRLTLFDAAGEPLAHTTTDAEGAYCFGDLPRAAYTVRATVPSPDAREVQLHGQGDDVNLVLEYTE